MSEIFKTLRDKFPFLSLIRKGDLEFVGIVQNQDNNVISFYDYGRLMNPQDKMRYLKCGEIWWYESNRKLPINIFLKGDFRYFRSTLVTYDWTHTTKFHHILNISSYPVDSLICHNRRSLLHYYLDFELYQQIPNHPF